MMGKRDATVRFAISAPIKFSDMEDLEQQVEDLRVELESLGFEIEVVKCKQEDDDEEVDEYEEERYDEDL